MVVSGPFCLTHGSVRVYLTVRKALTDGGRYGDAGPDQNPLLLLLHQVTA